MSRVFVQFSAADESVVASVFAGPQEAAAYPNQGEIDTSDPRYLAFADPTSTLPGAQSAQLAVIEAAYASAIAQDVTFTTSGGVTKLFQADPNSVANAQAMVAAYSASGVPAGFYWRAKDGTHVPFMLADLQGLAKTMGDQGWAAFQNLEKREESILAATTIAAVQAVTW